VFDYAASRYKKETMSEFQNLFKSVVAAIVNNTNTEGYTFSQITKDVRGKKGLLQRIKEKIFKIYRQEAMAMYICSVVFLTETASRTRRTTSRPLILLFMV
jgi:ribosomal protein L10